METKLEQKNAKTFTAPQSSHNVALFARLSEFVEKKGDNFGRLARSLDLSPTFFHSFKTKKSSIGSEALMKILMHYPELSAEWLLRGTGTMLIGTIYKDEVEHYHTVEKMTNELQSRVDDLVKIVGKLDKDSKRLDKVRNKKAR